MLMEILKFKNIEFKAPLWISGKAGMMYFFGANDLDFQRKIMAAKTHKYCK